MIFQLITFVKIVLADELIISSDEVIYKNNRSLILFNGNVTADYQDYKFSSNDIEYYKTQDQLSAQNKSRLESDDFLLIAEEITLTHKFQHAKIKQLHLNNFANISLFAKTGIKNHNDFMLDQTYFSMCKICRDKVFLQPIWHIESSKVKYKSEKDNFYFKNSVLNFYNYPIFYFPYLILPGNKYPKRSGFLFPEISNDNLLHHNISIPIFWNIKPNLDITYNPNIFRFMNINHNLQLRYLNKSSKINLKFSYLDINNDFISYLNNNDYTLYDSKKWRIISDGNYELSQGDIAFTINKTSKDEYLKRYFQDYRSYEKNNLAFLSKKSDLFIKYSYANDFSSSDRSFYRLPNIDYYKQKLLKKYGILNSINLNYENVNIESGIARDRASITNILSQEKNVFNNDKIEFGIFNRLNNYDLIAEDDIEMNLQSSIFMNWQRKYRKNNKLLIPKFHMSFASIIENNEINNLDSQDVQLKFTNLNNINDSLGYDIMNEAFKASFQLEHYRFNKIYNFNYKVGISYRQKVNSEYELGSGLDKYLSDLIQKVNFRSNYLTLKILNRIDRESFVPYYNSIVFSSSYKDFTLNSTISHFEYSKLDSNFSDQKNLSINMQYKVNDNLSISNISNFDYDEESFFSGGMTRNNFLITYKNECIITKLSINKTLFSNDNIKENTVFKISFDILTSLLDK